MRTPAAASVPVKAALVDWLAWSVLKISGLPRRASASSSAKMQERHVHGVRQPPRQHRPACPIDDRDGVEEAASDRHIGDARCPHLVRPVDRQAAQEIREDLVSRRRLRRSWLGPQRGDAHPAHRPLHVLAVEAVPVGLTDRRHPTRAEERPGREQLVDPLHQRPILVVCGPRRPIDAGARHAQERALPAERQLAVIAVQQRPAIRRARLPDLRAKKSRSTVSSPIFA
jgi:hypothetical protein